MPGIGTVISICIVVIAALGYVRLLLKRRNRRARLADRDQAEKRDQSDRMLDRLRDTFLWEKKSDEDSK